MNQRGLPLQISNVRHLAQLLLLYEGRSDDAPRAQIKAIVVRYWRVQVAALAASLASGND